jgi:hypothetical protein
MHDSRHPFVTRTSRASHSSPRTRAAGRRSRRSACSSRPACSSRGSLSVRSICSTFAFTSELATVQANRRRTEEVIGQYLHAFEHGTMPEDVCGLRLVELQAEQIQLRDRERELRELLATNSVRAAPDPGMLATLRRRIYEGLTNGNPEARKEDPLSVLGRLRPGGR